MADSKRVFTGLQPSGQLHIGNYFGALKPIVDLFVEHQGLLMIADYHALTTVRSAKDLQENILSVAKDFIAAGVNQENVIIFKQSDVPQHTELAWIFDCLVTVPFLMQAHAYKDKVAKGLEANAGLFNYPMLMAADILLYDTDIVPVGEDQRQHVEYAREAASKFNLAYGQTFKEPAERVQEAVAVVPGTDGQKMSKSYKNTIPLFGTKDEIAAAVMSIVTDSSGERPENVYRIHRLFRGETELDALYAAGKGNYKALKEALIEDLEKLVAPMRAKRDAITDEDVKKVLSEGGEKARTIASAKMQDVRQKIGVSL
ncbi:tryptophan--tRNA ligase [Candidatus Adlerbacteria bacterium RIFCSPLOWO2_01_FULL_54_21b]|uniref:Tryptophan--tRNA ligase n=2 Tax=Candidatus Adleribacteriota TaxID=1752736 RepID=A0A1F4XWC9_9BACT|nr:MAG: tryptophan--tRNA ligase [Candidatus Adlerbacteria bacterium RIFCSPLOWO2_01_FULL_54_21b]